MKIKCIDSYTKQPLANMKIQLQVRGQNSGYLSLASDKEGFIKLDEKYKGQQIAYYLQGNAPGQFINAADGAEMLITSTQTMTGKGNTTTQSYK